MARKVGTTLEHLTCCQCKIRFVARIPKNEPIPNRPLCGQLLCEAWEHWTPEQWQGRARMAQARIAAAQCPVKGCTQNHHPLDALDRHALMKG